MTTKRPAQVEIETVLDDLVNQFSDPHAFFRELIQNSIDAGSGEVDISFEFRPSEGDPSTGVAIAHIDDFGEGMTRDIIETKLTRLFSSAKDDDYTKIGRFGIGFVSVFAIQPDAVCVDTGRSGEYWRVLFHKDRSYDLIRMDQAIEGTQIQVIKSMTRAEFEVFEARATEVIGYWCKHVRVPIVVAGEEINQPLDVDAAVKVSYEEEGTRIVMGFVESLAGPTGYYNRGLTLKETEEGPWPHVAIKIDSRYLEHTLTRDQVLQDRNYHKAMSLMTRLAEEELPKKLFEELEHAASVAHQPDRRPRYETLVRLVLRYIQQYGALGRQRQRMHLFPTLYGEQVNALELQRAHSRGALFLTRGRSHVSDALDAMDERVAILDADSGTPLHALAKAVLGHEPRELHQSWAMPRSSDLARAPGSRRLLAELEAMLKILRGRPEWMGILGLDYPGAPFEGDMVTVLTRRGAPIPRSEVPEEVGRKEVLAAKHLAINGDDPRVAQLVEVARKEPEWAAYTFMKMVLLGDGLAPEDDELMVIEAIERRKRRRDKASEEVEA